MKGNTAIVIEGEAIRRYQLMCIVGALRFHVASKGKKRLTRGDYMGTARVLGYVGRTAKSLLADILAKNPDIDKA